MTRPAEFIQKLCDSILSLRIDGESDRAHIGRAMVDTVSVAAAGFTTPTIRKVMEAYRGSGGILWSGEPVESREAAIMINAAAAHALDFDDVYLDSWAHPSAVIVPVTLAGWDADCDIVKAHGAGLVTARAVAAALGGEHYGKGWHGTGTIGTFAAAATAGVCLGLKESELRAAFALAAAMSGGLQANFGTEAKPLQAGFAAAAGYRAARLSAVGVTGSNDVFADGYLRLYGTGERHVSAEMFRCEPGQVAVKLYPSCYATHRLIGVALDAREEILPLLSRDDLLIRLAVPQGSTAVLKYDWPTTGAEAKFSGPYNVATALIGGNVTVADFTDEAVARPIVHDLMTRISIVEDGANASGGELRAGMVELIVQSRGDVRHFTRSVIPGTPEDPARPDQLATKAAGCLEQFRIWTGTRFPLGHKLEGVEPAKAWLARLTVPDDEQILT